MADPIASNSVASQVYGGVQTRSSSDVTRTRTAGQGRGEGRLPPNATPQGDWVLRADANPQNFDGSAPRGTYLNVVV